MALLNRHEGIANTLVSHKCDLNLTDSNGNTLLHLAILRGDAFAASFLIKNGASTILSRSSTQETPLHLVALYKQSSAVEQVSTINIKVQQSMLVLMYTFILFTTVVVVVVLGSTLAL